MYREQESERYELRHVEETEFAKQEVKGDYDIPEPY